MGFFRSGCDVDSVEPYQNDLMLVRASITRSFFQKLLRFPETWCESYLIPQDESKCGLLLAGLTDEPLFMSETRIIRNKAYAWLTQRRMEESQRLANRTFEEMLRDLDAKINGGVQP